MLNLNKILWILRAPSGSGKSTIAEVLDIHFFRSTASCEQFEADMFFYDMDGNYNFDGSKLGEAHKWCREGVEDAMNKGMQHVIVSNTSTTEKEVKPYVDLAEQYGYTVFSLVVEKRHKGTNQHGVPEEKVEQMKKRMSVKL